MDQNTAFYFKSVANRINCSNDTRLLARSLLEQGHHFWFEDLGVTKLTNHFYKSVSLRTDVTCICPSSNEQLVAAGYKDGRISIFGVPDFQEVHTFDTMPESNDCRFMLLCDQAYQYYRPGDSVGPLWSCSFSPSSVRLVTCDGSEEVKLWDVNSEKQLVRLQAGGPVDWCSFSECGLFILANKKKMWHSDAFTVWNALTLQRVDRRNIRSTQQRVDIRTRYSSFRFLSDRGNNSELLLSPSGDCIDVFQLPDARPVARLYNPHALSSVSYLYSYIPPDITTRYHWRFCVLHHTNESIKLTDVGQLEELYRTNPFLCYARCPCDLEPTVPRCPVTAKKLYVVPFFNKLNIFSVADQPLMSIQPSFVSEPYVISCCCFSPDGSFLATCANGAPLSVLIWDTNLCTVIQVVRFPLKRAVGCWWSESLLWIYDGGLVKIPISNERTLDSSSVRIKEIHWEPRKLLTFSDVLIFIDQEKSVNVARIKNGELQYVETFPVDNPILCAAVLPCNSIIVMASSKTFHVWKEDQTSQPLHWVASNTGEILDFSRLKGSEARVYCECSITRDSTKGVLALYFQKRGIKIVTGVSYYLILVDLNSKIQTRVIPSIFKSISELSKIYAGNSYYIVVDHDSPLLVAVKLATGEYIGEWNMFGMLKRNQLTVADPKNDLVAIITKRPASVKFLKIVVPE